MSETDPTQAKRDTLTRELESVRRDAGRLRAGARFADLVKRATDRRAGLPGQRQELERLRGRGYVWRGDLEEKLAAAAGAADEVIELLREESRRAGESLERQLDRVGRGADRLRGDPLRHEAAIRGLAAEVDGLEATHRASTKRMEALAEPLLGPSGEVEGKLKDLHWTMDQFDALSGGLRPEENPVAASKASWEDAPRADDPPEGLLLFTDHRIRFEQNQEIVTKRKLFFFAAEKEKVQRVLLDEPVGHLLSSEDETRGMVFKDQLLCFRWDERAGAPRETSFKLDGGKAADWDQVVEAIRAGDLSRHRAGVEDAPPPAEVTWPEACKACGARLEPPVKGQLLIACGYCAAEHRVEARQAGRAETT